MAAFHPSDAFVALSPATVDGVIVFAKNAGHPKDVVHEVIYCPAVDHVTGSKIKCTYIEIDQLNHTNAVLLCKVPWTWGADMGANEKGVCIGNTPVDSNAIGDGDKDGKLTGPDLVRFGLERGNSAKEAVDVITSLLKTHGTGSCCEGEGHVFHNSYMIADRKEAWVLETAGSDWVAQHLTEGVRNISNNYTIHTKMDAQSEGVKAKGSDMDFAETFQVDACSGRFKAAKALMDKSSGVKAYGSSKVYNQFKRFERVSQQDIH